MRGVASARRSVREPRAPSRVARRGSRGLTPEAAPGPVGAQACGVRARSGRSPLLTASHVPQRLLLQLGTFATPRLNPRVTAAHHNLRGLHRRWSELAATDPPPALLFLHRVE